MKAFTNEIVLDAAREHAKEQLGNSQFQKNKDAAKSIGSDFIAGVKFVLERVKTKEFNLDLVDENLEYE